MILCVFQEIGLKIMSRMMLNDVKIKKLHPRQQLTSELIKTHKLNLKKEVLWSFVGEN